MDAVDDSPFGGHDDGVSRPTRSAGGATRPPHICEIGIPVGRVGVAHRGGEVLDADATEGDACITRPGTRTDESKCIFGRAEREFVAGFRGHTGGAFSRGTGSHSSSRAAKYQPPRS